MEATHVSVRTAPKHMLLFGLVFLSAAIVSLVAKDMLRRYALQSVLILMAVGEGFAGYAQVFRARHMSGYTGRPYDAAYHGVVQDFGFYNLAMCVLLAISAIDPARYSNAILAAIFLYGIHGGTHLLRYFGFYYGGETAIPTRPRSLELRDALTALLAFAGLLLFYP